MLSDKRVPYSFKEIIGRLKERRVENVVTMVGAGISTSAGIPDFRSPNCGLLSKMKDFHLPYHNAVFENTFFEHNPRPLFSLLKESMLSKIHFPTKSHYFVKLLEEEGFLRRHYTQNIDGLDWLAGLASDKLVEAHGTIRSSHCTRCQKEFSWSWLKAEVNDQLIPLCTNCSAVVKPDIVLFGDQLPENYRCKVDFDCSKCDLLVVMGTSLVVEPFASLVTSVPTSCLRLFINKIHSGEKMALNPTTERYNIPGTEIWIEGGNRDTIMHGECDDCVGELARLVGWEKRLFNLISEEKASLAE